MDRNFWIGKRVLVTGHTGFKGGWLSLWLQHLGANVAGYSLPPAIAPNFFTVAAVSDGMTSIFGDVRNLDAVLAAFDRHQPEIVFHLAAQSLVRASYNDPVTTYGTNVIGTVHMLEAARRCASVRAFVNVTSDKCYENREHMLAYRESDALGGHDPYSNSKACAELVTAAYRDSFFSTSGGGLAVATARAGNVIGGGDWAQDRLVPDLMRALERKVPLVVRSPSAIRPWQHVLEPDSGYLLLAERLCHNGQRYAQAWNFGPSMDDAKPVQWVVDRLTQLWGDGISWTLDASPQPHEAQTLMLDSAKAREQLGWRPRWPIDQAMASVVEWYRAYWNGKPMRAVVLDQIAAYSAA